MTAEPDSPKKRECLEDQFIFNTSRLITSKSTYHRDISERCDLINEEHPRIRNAVTVKKKNNKKNPGASRFHEKSS